jgi:hypothetical protein
LSTEKELSFTRTTSVPMSAKWSSKK